MNQQKPESLNCVQSVVSSSVEDTATSDESSRRVAIMDFGYVPNVERRDRTMNQRRPESSSFAKNAVSTRVLMLRKPDMIA